MAGQQAAQRRTWALARDVEERACSRPGKRTAGHPPLLCRTAVSLALLRVALLFNPTDKTRGVWLFRDTRPTTHTWMAYSHLACMIIQEYLTIASRHLILHHCERSSRGPETTIRNLPERAPHSVHGETATKTKEPW